MLNFNKNKINAPKNDIKTKFFGSDLKQVNPKAFHEPILIMNHDRDWLVDIIKFYCNFGHAIGMCPFQLSRGKNTNHLAIKKRRPATFLRLIISFVLLLYRLGNFRRDWVYLSHKGKHPFKFLYIGYGMTHILLVLTFLRLMWFGSCQILNLVNFLVSTNNNLPPIPAGMSFRVKVGLMSVLFNSFGGGVLCSRIDNG